MTRDWTILGGRARVLFGDCRERMRELPPRSVHCVVTSPPYFLVRDYGGGIGMESTPAEYVRSIVGVMREVRRVLRDDGTVWLNIGDKYVAGASGGVASNTIGSDRNHRAVRAAQAARGGAKHPRFPGLKPKDLILIPFRVALALQRAGWWVRQSIIWHKPAPQPESAEDRPTTAHEHVFLLTKSEHYFYDADAIRTPVVDVTRSTYGSVRRIKSGRDLSPPGLSRTAGLTARLPKRKGKVASDGTVLGANARSVWSIASSGYDGEHTSTYPEALVEPCIRAGCPVDGVVLDPFVGSGTTLKVALRLGRQSVGIEKDASRLEEIEKRLQGTQTAFPLPEVPARLRVEPPAPAPNREIDQTVNPAPAADQLPLAGVA